MMRNYKRVASVLLLLAVSTGASLTVNAQETEAKYKPGQKWSYKTRPGEEDSYLIVLKVDKHPVLGDIIHIALRKLKMKNEHLPEGSFSENVDHMPFSQEALDNSDLKLLEEKTDLPDFAEGYQLWREAFEAKRAGVYSITVAAAVNVMEYGLTPSRRKVPVVVGSTPRNTPPSTPLGQEVEGDSKKSPYGAPISGGVLNGRALKLPKPKYPRAARESGASGTVVVKVIIDENGKVISAKAINGHPDLWQASEVAAMQSEFSPTTLAGQPVKVTGVIQYNFVARR